MKLEVYLQLTKSPSWIQLRAFSKHFISPQLICPGSLHTPELRNFKLGSFKVTHFSKKKKKVKERNNSVFENAPKFPLQERKRSETQLAGEYCCATTQAAWRVCCGRPSSGLLEFRFQLDSRVYSCIHSRPHAHSSLTCTNFHLPRTFHYVITA